MLSHVVPLSDEERIVSLQPTVMYLLFPKVSPVRVFIVPEVLEVHVVPYNDEVKMVPLIPTATKVLFANAAWNRKFEVPEVFEVQYVRSGEVMIVPDAPTAT